MDHPKRLFFVWSRTCRVYSNKCYFHVSLNLNHAHILNHIILQSSQLKKGSMANRTSPDRSSSALRCLCKIPWVSARAIRARSRHVWCLFLLGGWGWQLVSVVRISHIFKPFSRPFLEGVVDNPQGIGDLPSPCLLTTYKSWDDPPSGSVMLTEVCQMVIKTLVICCIQGIIPTTDTSYKL